MSINFDEPVNDETRTLIKKLFDQQIVAEDRKTFLTKIKLFDSREMKEIANTAKQPARVELHGPGEIKTLEDGTRYEATAHGWRKIA